MVRSDLCLDSSPISKVRKETGRGGQYIEENYLFHVVLYSAGFDTHTPGARIYRASHYGGWTHNVRIAIQQYLPDGGYEPRDPVRPISLEHETEPVQIFPTQA
ncbi:hypothetical protein P153DRAFT_303591 [Dothidotthia symphoricarpi CBS 119687]|uniref:Uncharacterized protein n=1 Tax=Dothidotthia symphoricarpi CBS 119687 TaxID=1392245 RepID=A0A6A5ZYX4_9PLEO|nr:uncharacterized protein P153DRAFT_303591 [Dothidotthia symphoricarpi CBS 119687]KAF2123608.1 hypothetical protein P153DRAFT_303591 [Dothidotthia symphoricarpi CBS 119687]